MLTNNRFRNLQLTDRAEVLLEQGQMIMTRISGCYIVTLYQVADFFAEVWYCQQTPRIHRIEVVNMSDVYPLYEQNIDISDLSN